MESTKLALDIVTPYGHIFTDEVDEVVVSGSEGEFGVLPNHVPFLTTIKVGMLTYKKNTETGYFFVNWGFAEIGPDKVIILADSAERAKDINVERAKNAMKRAEERLRQAEQVDLARATASLDRAMTRVQVAERHQIK